MLIHVRTEKYPNPYAPNGCACMAHSDDIEAAGVFGFGATADEAVRAFVIEFERVKAED